MRNFDNPSRVEIFMNALLHHRLASPLYGNYAAGLDLQGDEHVLDFGAGSGALSRHLARRLLAGGGRVTCLDTSAAWINVARKRLSSFSNVEFHVADISAFDGDAEGYDVIIVHLVLHEIEPAKRQETVGALADKLKATGTLFIREMTGAGHGMSPDEIRQLMQHAGLTEVALTESRALLMPPMCAGVFRK
jgi:2-polyprenyl-3-methyl-5-hydroxy-6-metoxy-1,4-benzoquinol methylase